MYEWRKREQNMREQATGVGSRKIKLRDGVSMNPF